MPRKPPKKFRSLPEICTIHDKRKFTEPESVAEAARLTFQVQPTRNYFCQESQSWHVARLQERQPRGPSTYFSGDGTPRTLGRIARIITTTPKSRKDNSLGEVQ